MKLQNGEIFMAWDALNKLAPEGTLFPVRASMAIAHLRTKLEAPHRELEEVRNGLIRRYGEADPENSQNVSIKEVSEKKDDKGKVLNGKDGKPIMEPNPDFPKFAEEIRELMEKEVEVEFEKVKLPEKVAATCDKCSHNMDRMLEVEPNVLMALEKFVEIE